MKNTPLYLLGGAALVWFLTRASTINNLNFVPRGLSFIGSSVQVVIGVQNPTSNSLTLRSVVASLIVNGNTFGNVSDFQPVILAANSETPVALIFSPSLFGIADSVVSALQSGSTSISANLQGTANLDNNALPININF
jgi:hypothetical protein